MTTARQHAFRYLNKPTFCFHYSSLPRIEYACAIVWYQLPALAGNWRIEEIGVTLYNGRVQIAKSRKNRTL